MTPDTEHDSGPGEVSDAAPGRFGLLLVLLIGAYLLSALTEGRWISVLLVLLFTGAALLALRNWLLTRRTARLVLAVAVAGSAAACALLFTTETGTGIADIWAGLVLLAAAALIVHRVLSTATVTAQNIYGALSAYLVLGLMFAASFAAIAHLTSGQFFAGNQPDTTQTFQYFSFTTLTTLGYGDFTAAGNPGRALAVLEALTGQVFLVTLVASLVAQFRSPRARGAPRSPRR